MRPNNIIYLIRQGVKNLFTNKLMSFACIGVLVACMLLIGSALIFTLTVNNIVKDVEGQNQVVLYLKENLSKRDMDVVDLSLRDMDNIIDVVFISKEQALESYKKSAGDLAGLFAGLEGNENPLPDKYVLRVENSSLMLETISKLSNLQGVEKVLASLEVANILTGLKTMVYYAGASVVVILVVVSIVIISNTIKLTIFSRRKEINIMKYVGATDTFIRLPFLVEGMLIGIIAAATAFFILALGYTYLIGWARENYQEYLGVMLDNAVDFQDIALQIMVGFSSIGAFIGMAGSGFFVRKHLRV